MSAKRKAASQSVSGSTPESKRRKVPVIEKETPGGVTTAGIALINQLKEARDKRGREIAAQFLTLPSKDEVPDYYEVVVMPLAFDTIEEKLQRHEYPTLTTLESDLKRLVANAKLYNERTSEIHNDAEKIRKLVSHQMPKINPAYKDPNYAPFPTPLPDESVKQEDEDAIESHRASPVADAVDSDTKDKPSLILHGPSTPKEEGRTRRRSSATPGVLRAADAGESFEGNTFQHAQEKIVSELLDLQDDNGEPISLAFHNLPTRELRDYYQVVKRPVSLKAIQKQVRGIKGREKPTGVSFFKSWKMFEDEVSFIWTNARLYNEDGSAISACADQLEEYFKRRVAEAKGAVSEPAQPRVKLRMSTKEQEQPKKVTLHVTPRANNHDTSGVTIDTEALKRQNELVNAGINGKVEVRANGARRPSTSHQDTMPSTSEMQSTSMRSGSATSLTQLTNGANNEAQLRKSPAPGVPMARNASHGSMTGTSSHRQGSTSMPPPTYTTPRAASGSPYPQTNNTSVPAPVNPLDYRWRLPGKAELITELRVQTHNSLGVEQPFYLQIPPSPTLTQQSVTISLPSTHYCLIITATFPPVKLGHTEKYFLTLNARQVQPSTMRTDIPGYKQVQWEVKPNTQIVNRIEVERITAPIRGAPRIGVGLEIEFEKTTILMNYLS